MASPDGRAVRYAVLGLGHISQVAVLPAFQHAASSTLAALVSSDQEKLDQLGERYGVKRRVGYEELDSLLASGEIDAVYIGTPNHLHCEQTLLAARHGVHVLCEKPMATSEEECRTMVEACDKAGVQLMIAYRLHFERANLEAIEVAQSGRLGELRLFESLFTQTVDDEENIRLEPIDKGGGTVFDMGVYCINAARYLFRDEPTEVIAFSESRDDPRFSQSDEMTSAILRFPRNRIATFTSSFGATKVSRYHVVGTEGELRMDPAYEYATSLSYEVRVGGQTERFTYPKRDQFGPEISYFSDCVLQQRPPEPDGREGWMDVRIIEAIVRATRSGEPAAIEPMEVGRRPSASQRIDAPGIEKPPEINASGP